MYVKQLYTGCLSEAAYYIESNGEAAIVKRQGIHNLRNVLGGWTKIKEQKNVVIIKEPETLN